MKKIAVLNDIHGNLFLLNKVIESLKDKNIDKYIICGDFLTDGPDDNKIIETIKDLNAEVIIGNREETILDIKNKKFKPDIKSYPLFYTANNLSFENILYLESLTKYKIINYEGKKICISHGSPYNIRDMINFKDDLFFQNIKNDFPADIYLFAHSHRPFYKEYQNQVFINTGAINCILDRKKVTSYGIITINSSLISYEQVYLPYNIEEVKEYYLNSDYYKACPEWSMIILNVLNSGYNYIEAFSNQFDFSKSINENFTNFVRNYDLPIK